MKREKVKQVSKRLKEQLKELDAKDTASQEKLSSALNRVDAQEHHGLVDQIEEAAIYFEQPYKKYTKAFIIVMPVK